MCGLLCDCISVRNTSPYAAVSKSGCADCGHMYLTATAEPGKHTIPSCVLPCRPQAYVQPQQDRCTVPVTHCVSLHLRSPLLIWHHTAIVSASYQRVPANGHQETVGQHSCSGVL